MSRTVHLTKGGIMHPKVRYKDIDIVSCFGVGLMHVLAVFGFWYFSVSGFIICIALAFLTGWIGITLCYHRLLTHGSFKTYPWCKYVLAIMGTFAYQGGPIKWVGIHRLHHKHADEELDPHTPNHGFSWSHMLWVLLRDPDEIDPRDAAKDLSRDLGLVIIDKLCYFPQIFLAAALYGIGYWIGGNDLGLSWVFWGIGVRTSVMYHATWFVNSACHTWGYRNFDTRDRSTNLWWVAWLSAGEGWHNNHHHQQRSASHGMRWYEFDPTYRMIQLLGICGLAWNIVEPQPPED